jgi:hypothetical protein
MANHGHVLSAEIAWSHGRDGPGTWSRLLYVRSVSNSRRHLPADCTQGWVHLGWGCSIVVSPVAAEVALRRAPGEPDQPTLPERPRRNDEGGPKSGRTGPRAGRNARKARDRRPRSPTWRRSRWVVGEMV